MIGIKMGHVSNLKTLEVVNLNHFMTSGEKISSSGCHIRCDVSEPFVVFYESIKQDYVPLRQKASLSPNCHLWKSIVSLYHHLKSFHVSKLNGDQSVGRNSQQPATSIFQRYTYDSFGKCLSENPSRVD